MSWSYTIPLYPNSPEWDGETLLLPFWPESPLRHTIQFRTDVLKARDGTEARIALLRKPREGWEAEFILDDSDMRVLRRYLFTQPAARYEFPLRHEMAPLTADATLDVEIDDTYVDWAQTGRRVFVVNDAGDYYDSSIETVSDGTLTLADAPPVDTEFVPGFSWIMPMVDVRLRDSQPIGKYAVNATRWSLSCNQDMFVGEWGEGASLTFHDGLPVLSQPPSANELNQEEFVGNQVVLDYGSVQFVDWGQNYADIVRQHRFRYSSAAARQWWKKFLYTVRGAQKPFFLPTWLDDLIVHTQPTPGGTTLRVEPEDEYRLTWFDSQAHKRLQLELSDGSIIYRTAASVDNFGGSDRITFDTALPAGSYTVEKVSFLEQCRLSSDTISIDYTSSHATVSLGARTVQDTVEIPE